MSLLRVLAPKVNPASLAALDFGRVFLAVFAMMAEARPGLESISGTQPALDDADCLALQFGRSCLE